MSPPDLPALRAALAVAEHRSFRRAAFALDMSPSALSHAITNLEERIGLRIFHRTTRSVSLTSGGQQFLERLRPLVSEIAEVCATANSMDQTGTVVGLLKICSSRPTAQHLVLPLVAKFLEKYPSVTVELKADDNLPDIVGEGFDVGFCPSDLVARDLIGVSLPVGFDIAIVGAPSYFRRRAIPSTPADLNHHECIRMRLPSGVTFPWQMRSRGEPFFVDVKGSLVVSDDELKLAAARLGCGLAYTTTKAVEADLISGSLISVLADWTPKYPPSAFSVCYPARRLMPRVVRAFVDLTREVAQAHAAQKKHRKRGSRER